MRLDSRRLVASLTAACVVSACAVGPDYERPDLVMPDSWRFEYQEAADLANTRWWERFEDPVLNELIDLALRENLDIRIAAARVDQFQGALRSTHSQFFPQFDYGGDVSRNRVSEDAFGSVPGGDPYFTQYQAALGAAWQLDLFGRIRRQTEAAQARVYATEQARRGVILSVLTGVAASYVTLRGLDRQLEISRATADVYGETFRIFELRYRYGTVSRYELSQVESQYQQALAAIPVFEAQVDAQENLLSILLGRNPGPVIRGQTLDEMALPAVPEALPASLLERRPDVVQAEENLIAANAEIGLARSLYYPDIAITGAYGAASTDLDDFLDSSARAWNIGASITGPIFTAGNIAGQVQSAEGARQAAEDFYRQTILNALREVNDALVATEKSREAYDAQARRVAALREYARLAYLRFDNGAASYLEVLYANNELFAAELTAVNSQIVHLTSLIDVYKSIGGGWVDEAVAVAPTVDEVMSREK
jgi:multidrug efflux system outer membrane protein